MNNYLSSKDRCNICKTRFNMP